MREVQMSIGELYTHLSDIVTRVTHNDERVILLTDGQPAAAVIGIEDLRRLQAANGNATADRYEVSLAAADRIREQIQQWQTQRGIQPADSVETLHELREAYDARHDRLH